MGPEPKGERLQAIAGAIAARAMGMNQTEAAALARIPRSTFQLWEKRVARDPGALKKVEEIIVDSAADVAGCGFNLIYDKLPDMDHGKLIAATGMATDKLAMYRGWGRGRDAGGDLGSQIIDRIGQLEGKVSLNVTYERTSSVNTSEPSSVSKPSDPA